MNDIDNQTAYWNRVASVKTFTHPLDATLLKQYINLHDSILDFGCGYGRITAELYSQGFTNITGVDTSIELINRGKAYHPHLNLLAIENAQSLPLQNGTVNAIILFAVLTCIPSNEGQKQLIAALFDKLKDGGIIYISDYYLQESRIEVSAYENYHNDPSNFGVFTLNEGATFRHHTKGWIKELLRDFDIAFEKPIEVKTMNGHLANAFQIIARKEKLIEINTATSGLK